MIHDKTSLQITQILKMAQTSLSEPDSLLSNNIVKKYHLLSVDIGPQYLMKTFDKNKLRLTKCTGWLYKQEVGRTK